MCGIVGIVGLKGIKKPEQVLNQMVQKMKHRGPDDNSTWIKEDVAFGHARLSIIDLGDQSNQPFTSEDGRYTIVFNGEIYNYQELKKTLDYPFRTNSDTEVLLAAYIKWGADCCRMLNGMFAFAIHDNEENEVFIARDRLGIKPLYFYNATDNFVFASEIRSLLECPIVPRKISQDALVDYLRYQTVQAPNTILKDVEMLPPGHYIKVAEDDIEIGKYWDLVENRDRSGLRMSRDEVKIEIRSKLLTAVERRLVANVPFGAFLSGGIDSSALVGLMSESATDVKTFSITFEEAEFSEAKYARMVAEKFGTDHTEIQLSPTDFLKDLPDALNAMDHPSGDGPNTYIVSKATKEAGVTMVLSGLGGDELFAGYDIFKRSVELHNKRWLQSFPKVARKGIGGALKMIKPSVASNKINEILRADKMHFEYTYPISRQVLLDKQILTLLNREKLPDNWVFDTVNDLVGEKTSGIELPLLSKVSVAEISTYMQNVLLRDTDQMSMNSALEVRVPFLDHELVEFAIGIPDDLKFPNYPKQLLVESLGDLLPDEIVHRPKMGFVLPWEQWMKGELKTFCEERLMSLAKKPFMSQMALEDLWNRFLKGDKEITWSRLWYLVVLENWMVENDIEF
ncbi:MAG: asparagine synthase (glutamine-hydrolyzing) [Flavobacteriales bacterium]|nr:asparagine synthase (glutamine-hydrolyzing) [Flavobacteriales bacterium]